MSSKKYPRELKIRALADWLGCTDPISHVAKRRGVGFDALRRFILDELELKPGDLVDANKQGQFGRRWSITAVPSDTALELAHARTYPKRRKA